MPDGDALSDALAAEKYIGSLIKVSFEIYVRNGMDGQKYRDVFMFTPKQIYNFDADTKYYRFNLFSGHALNPSVAGNVIEIQQRKRAVDPRWIEVSFLMYCDGKPFASEAGVGYIVAFGGTGETIQGAPLIDSYNSDGSRVELHFGDPVDREEYADVHHWISSSVRNLDVELIKGPELRAKLHQKRGSFTGQ